MIVPAYELIDPLLYINIRINNNFSHLTSIELKLLLLKIYFLEGG